MDFKTYCNYLMLHTPSGVTDKQYTQVKCQAGYVRDLANPTWDPRWEWRDHALGGGIPPFPPGMNI